MSAQAITTEAALSKAMAERRSIEAEMAGIDGKIKDAILSGDVAEYQRLTKRKAELPTLYIRVSHSERELSNRIHGQNRADAEQALARALANLAEQKASFESLQQRHKRELEEASDTLRRSEEEAATAQMEFLRANSILTNSQEGCKAALNRIAEAF
jgi:hypothetical protein